MAKKKLQPLTDEMRDKFATQLQMHIEAVREAGRQIGVPKYQLSIHDDCKWCDAEFPHYVRCFFGPNDDPEGFQRAWLHHIHHSGGHHWQSWIIPAQGPLAMPRNYILEMVADWMGASYVYTKSWNMVGWLKKNLPRMVLHPKTVGILKDVLTDVGYGDIVHLHPIGRGNDNPVGVEETRQRG